MTTSADNEQVTKPKKKRRVRARTRVCNKCFTPSGTVTRCTLREAGPVVHICDLCWPTYCDDNPGYRYLGTWQQGRIVDAEPLP